MERNKRTVLLTLVETNPENPGYNQIVAMYTNEKCLRFHAPNTRNTIILRPDQVDELKSFVKNLSESTPANTSLFGSVVITYTDERCLCFYAPEPNQIIVLHPEQFVQFNVFLKEIEGIHRGDAHESDMTGKMEEQEESGSV